MAIAVFTALLARLAFVCLGLIMFTVTFVRAAFVNRTPGARLSLTGAAIGAAMLIYAQLSYAQCMRRPETVMRDSTMPRTVVLWNVPAFRWIMALTVTLIIGFVAGLTARDVLQTMIIDWRRQNLGSDYPHP